MAATVAEHLFTRAASCLTWRASHYRARAQQSGDAYTADLMRRWAENDEADAAAMADCREILPSRVPLADMITALRAASPGEPWQAKHLAAAADLLQALAGEGKSA